MVVSATTAELTRDCLPAGCDLLDLGHWSLRDVPRPLHAYELRHRELGSAVRSFRAGRPGTGTLPLPSTSFVGRDAELVELVRLVDQAPIVTLTGVGGVGKTRLAVHFGAIEGGRFAGGTWFCDLSVATTGDEVVERLAAALGLRAASTSELRVDLSDWLRFSEALLIVDNCEHVAATAAAEFAPMVREGGLAKVVFTSRRALGLPGEHVMLVHPLRRLSAGSQAQGPRVALLIDRARAAGAVVDAQDPALLQVVDRLDGLPLAIELAARRLTAMTPTELEIRLSRSFDLLEAADGSRATPSAPGHDRLVVRAAFSDVATDVSPPCPCAKEGSDWSWPRLSAGPLDSMTARWRTRLPICGISPLSARRGRSPAGLATECLR